MVQGRKVKGLEDSIVETLEHSKEPLSVVQILANCELLLAQGRLPQSTVGNALRRLEKEGVLEVDNSRRPFKYTRGARK